MIIERIHIYLIRLPFRVTYGHKQKTHKDVFAVICRISDDKGCYGLGEAVPRTYVTGETAESVFQNAQTLGKDLIGRRFSSCDDLKKHMVNLSGKWPSPFPSCAFCCIDLALHDCLARHQGLDMAAYFGARPQKLPYTGSIGISNKSKLLALLSIYRFSGIRSLKLKVGDEHDVDRLRTIKSFMGQDTPVFADANGAWSAQEAEGRINKLAEEGIWAIEEPLRIPMPPTEADESMQINRDACMQDAHFEQYARLRQNISVPVILDESLISPYSFKKIIKYSAADILNLRLSKLGGYSLIPKMLEEKPGNMKFSLCAMVGESPILAAAGYFYGCAFPDHLYIQGYSHRILHSTRFTRGGPVMKKGSVFAKNAQAGLGVEVKPEILKKLTIKEEVLTREKA